MMGQIGERYNRPRCSSFQARRARPVWTSMTETSGQLPKRCSKSVSRVHTEQVFERRVCVCEHRWDGARKGYVFTTRAQGTGYYLEDESALTEPATKRRRGGDDAKSAAAAAGDDLEGILAKALGRRRYSRGEEEKKISKPEVCAHSVLFLIIIIIIIR